MKFRTIALLVVALISTGPYSTPAQEVCGGIAGIPCESADEFCLLPDGECCCDFQGICIENPQTCPEVYEPVCGCDGLTYDNRCRAMMVGVSVAHRCPCDDADRVRLTAFTGLGRLFWEPAAEALVYNVYLQNVDHDPQAFEGSCLYWSVPENSVVLRGEPVSGRPWMFDVTVVSLDGEGPLGLTSSCTPRTPLAPCTCTLPSDVGPCDGIFPRWFHNFTTGRCEQFIWGGCDPGANNFETQADCEAACLDPCDQPAVQGECEAAIPRWYHNVLTGQCEQFIWGGCDPGANNFVTQDECEAACG